MRPVTPSLRWITLRHRVPLCPLWKGEMLPENWWCTELTLTVRMADGCCVPVDDDGDATFFFCTLAPRWRQRSSWKGPCQIQRTPRTHTSCVLPLIMDSIYLASVSLKKRPQVFSSRKALSRRERCDGVRRGWFSLSRGMPTPSSEHNHEERVLHPPVVD